MSIPGMVEIGTNEIGIVFKKLGAKLPPGKKIALHGEAGYQADILPPGQHFGYFSWLYEIRREPIINIPPGEIGLVVAKDGEPISKERILGRVVKCEHFQDARAFLENGGQKGKQLDILTTGDYKINTELFTVITGSNAHLHGMDPEDLRVYKIPPDTIGIVTTEDGKTIPAGEIAGATIKGHKKFQDPQKFIDLGGYKGLQEEILPTGSWNLNPWFVKVEQAPLTKIEPGRVGVVVSHVGKTSFNTDNDLVDAGYKGVWKKPLYPGKHAINTRVMDVIIVPTHQITLDWSNREKPPTNYDANLHALKLRSQDGFGFGIELTQVINISAENAPKMISRIGSPETIKRESTDDIEAGVIKFTSIKNLVTRVLEPMIGNHFRNSAQNYEALQFHENRNDRQEEAKNYIEPELEAYGVNSEGTFINEIDLPDKLEQILTERKIHEQGIEADKIRHIREIQEKKARVIVDNLQVDADAYRKKREIELLGGFQNYLAELRVRNLPQIRLPNVLVSTNGGQSGLLEAYIAPMLDSSNSQQLLPNSSQPQLSTGNTTNTPQIKASVPRCPVIFLLDTSSSLSNEYLEGLVEGINTFEEQLSQDDTASRCVEVAIITFGNSAKVVQTFTNAGNFSLHQMKLGGTAATGRGIELSLKIIEHRQRIYTSQNIQHYQPWIFLITGSNPNDNWQDAVQQVKQAVGNQQLNFLTVGVENADMNILNQIAPPKFPATKLEGLKFEPLFYGLAHLMKRIAHRQEKESLLEGLVNAVEKAKSSLPPEQAEKLEEYAAKLMSEVAKEKPSRQDYTPNVAKLIKTARQIGEDGNAIVELVPDITKILGFK